MKPTYLICMSCHGRRRFHAFGIQTGTFGEEQCPKCKRKVEKKEVARLKELLIENGIKY